MRVSSGFIMDIITSGNEMKCLGGQCNGRTTYMNFEVQELMTIS